MEQSVESGLNRAAAGFSVVAADFPSGKNLKGHLSEAAKRLFDLLGAVGILSVLIPIFLITIVFLLLSQGRPLFVAHRRVGRRGKPFSCFKFRTMVVNAEPALQEHLRLDPVARHEWEATRKLRNDPRITRFGRALRASSVDELPQLVNVLKGDMSLVGPRPIVEDECSYYGVHIQKYYQVRPGLTGPWQVGGRSDTSYTTRVHLDTAYVDHRSFTGDIWILLKTVPAVLRSRGAV